MLSFISAQEIYFQKILFADEIKKITKNNQNFKYKIIVFDLENDNFFEIFPNFFSNNLFNDFIIFKIYNFKNFFQSLTLKKQKEILLKLALINATNKNYIFIIDKQKLLKNSLLTKWILKKKITLLKEPELNFVNFKKFITNFLNKSLIKYQKSLISTLTYQLPLNFSFAYSELRRLSTISKNWTSDFIFKNINNVFQSQSFQMINAVFYLKNKQKFFQIFSNFDFDNEKEKNNFVINFFHYLIVFELIIVYLKLGFSKKKIIENLTKNHKISFNFVNTSYDNIKKNAWNIFRLQKIFNHLYNYLEMILIPGNLRITNYYNTYLKFKILKIYNLINNLKKIR